MTFEQEMEGQSAALHELADYYSRRTGPLQQIADIPKKRIKLSFSPVWAARCSPHTQRLIISTIMA